MSDMQLVLHGLAIKKHGTAEAVASVLGSDETEVREVLDQAVSHGRAVLVKDAYMLSPAARMSLDGAYPRLYAVQRSDTAFVEAYEQFEVINRDLKRIMTAWQTIEVKGQSLPNDHADKAYDERVLDQLNALHERVESVLDRLAKGLARLAVYKDKLGSALDKAEDGEVAWVSGVEIDSYHTVWFELHEDLLRILGREREE